MTLFSKIFASKSLILLLVLLIIKLQFASAQSYGEIGVMGGTTTYMGDINPYKPFSMLNPAGGILYRYNFTDRLAIRFQGLYGKVQSDDIKTKTNLERNLNFHSHILEGAVQFEVNFFRYYIGSKKHNISPYFFGGISYFGFKPYAMIDNNEVELKPLHTEGQTTGDNRPDEYKLSSFSIPFGIGFKYSLNKHIGLGLEWGLRKTYTDYLDDVSTTYYLNLGNETNPESSLTNIASDPTLSHLEGMKRGNSKDNDWYSFAGLIVTVKINTLKREKCLNEQKDGY